MIGLLIRLIVFDYIFSRFFEDPKGNFEFLFSLNSCYKSSCIPIFRYIICLHCSLFIQFCFIFSLHCAGIQCLMYLYHYPDIWYDYATWHAKSGSIDAAVKVFQRALKALPGNLLLIFVS